MRGIHAEVDVILSALKTLAIEIDAPSRVQELYSPPSLKVFADFLLIFPYHKLDRKT